MDSEPPPTLVGAVEAPATLVGAVESPATLVRASTPPAPETGVVAPNDPKRRIIRSVPLHQNVLHDLEHCAVRFALCTSHTFVEFRRVFDALRMPDILRTQRASGRMPAYNETDTNYAQQLLHAAVQHALRRGDEQPGWSFEHRLGGLFLVYTLHAVQRCSPPGLVPVSEEDWTNVEALAAELRERKHADGFRALHSLQTSGSLLHMKSQSLMYVDTQQRRASEQQAALIPAKVCAAHPP
eukprot:267047-Prymnesium_polylepis.2